MTASRPHSRARRVTVGLAALTGGLVVYLAVAHHELAWEVWYLRRLQSPAKAEREAALEALVKMRSSRAVAPLLAAAVAGLGDFLRKAAELLRRSEHVEVRRAAVRVITEAGQRAREVLPELREAAATDADGTVRDFARRLAEGL